MTNKEFAERLIARIENHDKNVCPEGDNPIREGYKLAHEHIIGIIKQEAGWCD